MAIVGFGYVGSCVAATLAEQGIRVFGVDNDPKLIEEMLAGYCRFNEPRLAETLESALAAGTLTLSADYKTAVQADVIIIAVGTPIDARKTVVTKHLEAVCSSLAPVLRPGQLVILKSTVAPGTTSELVRPLLEKAGGRDFGLAFCPERLAEGAALAEFRSLPIVIGGCDEEGAEAARKFWEDALDAEVLMFARPEIAELVKLADNWWIDANVALANELAQLCGQLGVDVLDVIAGANSLPKGAGHVNILLPSVGVGGSCLTKDPWILWSAARARGVRLRMAEIGREVNDGMPGFTYRLIRSGLADLGKDLAAAKVAVLGLAFKNNTNDLRHTPVAPVVAALRTAGARVEIYDPLVADSAAEAAFGQRQAASVAAAVAGADCVAVLAGHDQIRDLDFAGLARQVSLPALLVDGRAYYPPETLARLRALGFAYRGIGR
ncbi:MAG TPA: nucleotide sugar dehydrogenase [Streptosporangiaceae bacterium]